MVIRNSKGGKVAAKPGKDGGKTRAGRKPQQIDARLAATARKMSSGDYRERFQAEAEQLKIRVERLRSMLSKLEAGMLGFEPKCPARLLERQLGAMEEYLTCLEERAQIEGIEV